MGVRSTMPRKSGDPPGLPARIRAFVVKSTPAWKGWVERLAAHNRSNIPGVVDAALMRYAKETGFEEEPPIR